jgi:hypothetical protein
MDASTPFTSKDIQWEKLRLLGGQQPALQTGAGACVSSLESQYNIWYVPFAWQNL